jgi:hypothetical protein
VLALIEPATAVTLARLYPGATAALPEQVLSTAL